MAQNKSAIYGCAWHNGRIGTAAECATLYPAGNADYDRWTGCGQRTGCFALMP